MCNRARFDGEPETLFSHFKNIWVAPRPMDNRFNPKELAPKSRAYVVRQDERGRGVDIMRWDLLAGVAAYAMTNVRDLQRWKARLEDPAGRCLIPLTEFCEWTPGKVDLGDGKPPLKGEMWFQVKDQPIFAVAGIWQQISGIGYFAMMTCDPNELVAPIHPKAMVTILAPEDHERWLTGSYDDVVALQQPYPADRMTVRGPEFPTRKVG